MGCILQFNLHYFIDFEFKFNYFMA